VHRQGTGPPRALAHVSPAEPVSMPRP
jgi:hypothetical protein